MLKRLGLGAALLIAGAVPAFAEDTCQAPPIPAVVDGNSATRDQLVAGIAAVKGYISASDTYQACIADYLAVAKTQADKDKKPVDPALVQAEGDKVTANQNNKQKVGDAINVSIGAWKKAHPG
jgi:alpha-beta hydrolase superfamily lysophospholipase